MKKKKKEYTIGSDNLILPSVILDEAHQIVLRKYLYSNVSTQ